MDATQMRDWMNQNLGRLQTLRDESRVDLHLAGMEAKDRWRELEPALRDAERLVEDVSDVSGRAMEELVECVRTFRDSLRQPPRAERTPCAGAAPRRNACTRPPAPPPRGG